MTTVKHLVVVALLLFCVNLSCVHAQIFFCPSTITPNPTICLEENRQCLASASDSGFPDSTLAEYIVALHNVRRAKIAQGFERRGTAGPQPETRCMARLVWDNELAATAQRWADQCRFTSDEYRNKNSSDTVYGSYVGQNIFGFVDPERTEIPWNNYPAPTYWEQAINSWFDEVVNYDGQVGSYVYSAANGHYTQAAWGRSFQVGCGFRRWQLDDGTRRFARILVCNYFPGGNQVNTPVYIPFAAGQTACIQASCGTSFPANRTPLGNLCV